MNQRKNNIFTSVPRSRVPRNMFDLSHEVKMSCKMGILYPILVMDCLPGDTIRDSMTCMARFAPMLAPVMHRIDVTTHFFFVPNRILSDHWEDFITGGPGGITEPILPYINADDVGTANLQKGSLWDYMGLPPAPVVAPTNPSVQPISVLPFWCYIQVWNDYYRDPNLDTAVDIDTTLQGNVSASFISGNQHFLRSRGWEKDYFTSALPWAQRGAEVLMPLAGTGSVTYLNRSLVLDEDGNDAAANLLLGSGNVTPFLGIDKTGTGVNGQYGRIENIDEVNFDGSSVTINDFRRTLAIQKWLENNARGGGRYIEQIDSHFNVTVPDFRLQRAEYLGGGKQPVVISEVVSTATTLTNGEDTVETPLGDLAGHGLSVGKSNRFTYRCMEHGHVIGIMSIVPRTAYSQGIDRMWTRESKYDYAWPELAHLGEQQILSREIFFSFDSADNAANNATFGYIPRYAEYKFKNDRIAGDFRTTLDYWHLGRFFTQRPALDSTFTTMYDDNPSFEETYRRIFANQDGTDYIWCQLYHRLTAKRPLPYFGVPSI